MNSSSEPPSGDANTGQSGSKNPDRQSTADAGDELERSLAEVERSLQQLKERYAEIQRDRHRLPELQQRQEQVKKELRYTRSPQLREELRLLQQELEAIELNLESSLVNWGSFKEPFWQAVRFGGIGIAIGWILKSCAG
jgi:predicted RNase H-like nuclease (RuvC/YqgF family)